MEIAGITQTQQTSVSSGTEALNQLGEDYTTFLQLLTAQISNQDPLEPIDSTTFVTQLAQLTQVEQSAQTNITLETLASKLDAMALNSGAALVGQEASFVTETLVLGEGTPAEASYKLASTATTVSAQIFDPTGQLVRTISGLPGAADTEHALSWDGRTDGGTTALTGAYQVRLQAFDDLGNPIESAIYRSAPIEEVNLASGQLIYRVDGAEYVPSENIRSLK